MTIDSSLVWNTWIGYTKPLMDLRDDAPMPSPPDDPPATEGFWHSCSPAAVTPALNQFDSVTVIVPDGFDATAVVEPAGFAAEIAL